MARHLWHRERLKELTLPSVDQLRRSGPFQSRFLLLAGMAIPLGLFGLIDPTTGRLDAALLAVAGTLILVLTLLSIGHNEEDAETLPRRRTAQEKARDEARTGESPLRRS